jgi:hypothetical protein
MPTESVACPFCNALVPVPPGAAEGRRVDCPRCGESFALRLGGITTAPAALAAADFPRRPLRSNSLLAAAVLGVMALMAAVGLIFALHTQKDRRAHDTALPRKSRRPALEDQPLPQQAEPDTADRLAALGYLPPRTNVVAAVRLAELLRQPAGKALLDEPFTVGSAEIRLGETARWAGLALQDIDHLAVGLRADEPLSVLLVVRARQPYDAEKVRAALRAGHRIAGKPGGPAVYPFTLAPVNLPAVLACPDERTLLIGLVESSLAQTRQPAGANDLPAEIRAALRERVEPDALAWVAGHVEDWGKTAAPSLLERLGPEVRDGLLRVRTFAAWVRPGEPPAATADLLCADEAAARRLEESLRKAKGEGGAEVGRDGAWVTARRRAGPDDWRRWLRR